MRTLIIIFSIQLSLTAFSGEGDSGGGPRAMRAGGYTIDIEQIHNFEFSSMAAGIQSFNLKDGRAINPSNGSVEAVEFYQNSLDYLQLTTGEIVDRTDIKSIQFSETDYTQSWAVNY